MFGSIRKLYRNTLFRLSLLGALLFVLSLFAALGYIYYATIASELRRIDRANEAEIAELQSFYDRAGQSAIKTAFERGVLPRSISPKNENFRGIYHQAGYTFLKNAVFQRGLSNSNVLERVYFLQGPGGEVTGNLNDMAGRRTGVETSLLQDQNSTRLTRLEFLYSVSAGDGEGEEAGEEQRIVFRARVNVSEPQF